MAAKNLAENGIEARARAEVPEAGSLHADIDSTPFLPRLLASGSAGDVDLRLEQVPTRAVELSSVDIELRGVEVDRDALFSRQVAVNSIDHGTVSVELDAASLSRALGVPVTVGGGELRSRVGPLDVSARPAVAGDGALLLRLGSMRLTVALPRSKLLPCAATRAAVTGDRVRLSCEFDDVPPAVRRRLSG